MFDGGKCAKCGKDTRNSTEEEKELMWSMGNKVWTVLCPEHLREQDRLIRGWLKK